MEENRYILEGELKTFAPESRSYPGRIYGEFVWSRKYQKWVKDLNFLKNLMKKEIDRLSKK